MRKDKNKNVQKAEEKCGQGKKRAKKRRLITERVSEWSENRCVCHERSDSFEQQGASYYDKSTMKCLLHMTLGGHMPTS